MSEERVKPAGPIQAPSGSPASGTSTPDVSSTSLMEAVLDEQNLRLALRRVVANHGAPGVDRVFSPIRFVIGLTNGYGISSPVSGAFLVP